MSQFTKFTILILALVTIAVAMPEGYNRIIRSPEPYRQFLYGYEEHYGGHGGHGGHHGHHMPPPYGHGGSKSSAQAQSQAQAGSNAGHAGANSYASASSSSQSYAHGK